MTWCDDGVRYDIKTSDEALMYVLMMVIYYTVWFFFIYGTYLTFGTPQVGKSKTLAIFYGSIHVTFFVRILYLYGGLVCYLTFSSYIEFPPTSYVQRANFLIHGLMRLQRRGRKWYHSDILYRYVSYAQEFIREAAFFTFFLRFVQAGLATQKKQEKAKYLLLWRLGWIGYFFTLGLNHLFIVVYAFTENEDNLLWPLVGTQAIVLTYTTAVSVCFILSMKHKMAKGMLFPNFRLYVFVFVYLFVAAAIRIVWNIVYATAVQYQTVGWTYLLLVMLPDVCPYFVILYILLRRISTTAQSHVSPNSPSNTT